ncbi:hypothetical protein JOQ06_026680, partial [Pogonophryne albipinna]
MTLPGETAASDTYHERMRSNADPGTKHDSALLHQISVTRSILSVVLWSLSGASCRGVFLIVLLDAGLSIGRSQDNIYEPQHLVTQASSGGWVCLNPHPQPGSASQAKSQIRMQQCRVLSSPPQLMCLIRFPQLSALASSRHR